MSVELQDLWGNSFDCKCGRRHQVPVQKFVYEQTATEHLPAILEECTKRQRPRSTMVVADKRTWEVCGKRVYHILKRGKYQAKQIIVADRDREGPGCDDTAFEWLKGQMGETSPDVVIAVGSGVINDLCKWACFALDVPYMVVATAASMNGYAAANVAAQIAGVKVLVEARPPVAVVAEPQVIENAPREMTAAGFGDVIARYQSSADWVMNNLLWGEYYCEYCAELTTGLERSYMKRPEDIREAKSEAVKDLFETLFWAGIAMTLVGSSAPASGGEHLLSHTLDMIADLRHERHDLHGRQVGLGAIFLDALYEKLLRIDRPTFAQLPEGIDEQFWSIPAVINAVNEQYKAKKPQLEIMREKIARPAMWEQIKATLKPMVKAPREVKQWLQSAGGASSIAEIGCSRERIKTAVLHMHQIRKRCTVVDLAWVLGVLPDAADEIIDEWLIS